MHLAALVAGTLLTIITGVALTGAFGLTARSERLLGTLVLAVAQVVATLLFAGLVLRSLAAATVLIVNLAVTLAIVAVVARNHDLPSYLRGEWRALQRVRLPRHVEGMARSMWAAVLAVVVAIEVAYLALVAYIMPSASWDSLLYHLPAVAAWLQGDRILITSLTQFANVYPMNGELAFLWVAALTRSDSLVDGVPLVFAVIGAVGVASIARAVGVSKAGSFVAGSLYLLTPLVLAQATTNYVDLVLPSLFLAGYAFLLRYALAAGGALAHAPRTSGGRTPQLVLAGIAIGVAAGSKSTGALYAAIAVVVVAANAVWWHRAAGVSWRACLIRVGAFVLPVLAFGSFWYVRTWVEYGNPTYPFRIGLAGVTVFDGRSPSNENPPPLEIAEYAPPVRAVASWTHIPSEYTYDQRLDGFGPTWLLFELPALLIYIVFCAFRRRAVLYQFLLPFVVMFVLTPSNWWSRFTLFIVGPAAVALVFLVEQVRARTLALALQSLVIVSVVSGCVITARRDTVPFAFTPGEILSRAFDRRSDRTLAKVVLPEYEWTDTVARRSRIGVYEPDVPGDFLYSLFGTDFRNRVVGFAPDDLTAESLVPTLRDQHIDYFVTRQDSPRDAVARANAGDLELFRDSPSRFANVRVYRVKSDVP